MSRGERSLVFVAISMLALCGMLGFAPNIAAYDYDNEIDLVTVTFNDTMAVNMSEGARYTTTENQTSISLIYIYWNFIHEIPADTTVDYLWVIIITSPNGSKEFIYPEGDSGTYTIEEVPPIISFHGSVETDPVNDTYSFDEPGTYRFNVEKYLFLNMTGVVTDTHTFEIIHGHESPEITDLGIGDWEWFELTLGFVGVIGFVATPMITAKLMSSKDPITLMSAFLICMIMFGTFIYVFLLGGS